LVKWFWIIMAFLFFVCIPSLAATPDEVYAANVLRGDSLFYAGSYAQAGEAYQYATTFIRGNYSLLVPPPAEVFFRIGLCELELGYNEKALGNFDTALQWNTDPAFKRRILLQIGNTSLALRKYTDAQEYFVASGMTPEAADARIQEYRAIHEKNYLPPTKSETQKNGTSATPAETGNETILSPAPVSQPAIMPDQNLPVTGLSGFFIAITIAGLVFLVAGLYYRKTRSAGQPVTPSLPESPEYGYPSKTTTVSDSLSGKSGGHYDVFISYSHHDQPVSYAVCAGLEAKGIRCWIAPRDVAPGENFPDAIIRAIEESRTLVLVFSRHSNNSPHVIRELTKAVSLGLIVIPFRTETVPLSRSMEYLLGLPTWIDALTPPIETHIRSLVDTMVSVLGKR
jgi:hypothetical protein